MEHSDWYLNRDEQEAVALGQRIREGLDWFFSDESLRACARFFGSTGNRFAYINAYIDHCERKYMVWDPISNYKRGCSFWGVVLKEDWLAKSASSREKWSLAKAREILHLN